MKIAILLLIHKNIEQVKMLVQTLKHPNIKIFIHADSKMTDNLDELNYDNVIIIPNNKRVNIIWSQNSMVKATINLIQFAQAYDNFDYFWLCSGQDFPIANSNYIVDFLAKNPNKNYINFFNSKEYGLGYNNNYDKRNQIIYPKWIMNPKKHLKILKRIYVELTGGYNHTFKIMQRKDLPCEHFYFGASWWCLNNETINWIICYNKEHPEYFKFFETCLCSDESFFHTLVMMSPFKKNVNDYLHYIDWSGCKNSPNILKTKDYDSIIKSDKLMARKFDIDVDSNIIIKLKKKQNEDK